MAPSAVDTAPAPAEPIVVTKLAPAAASTHREPLKPTGVLDQFKSFEVTPTIGREFPDANLVEWLDAPNADELLRDLAIASGSLLRPPPPPPMP